MGATESEPAAAGPPPERRAVGLSSTVVFLVSVLVQGLGVVASVTLSRTIGNMGPTSSGGDLLGAVALILLIASSINQIGDLRIGAAFTYFLSRGQPATQSTWSYFLIRIAMVGAGGAILLAAAPVLPYSQSTPDYFLVFAVWMTFPVLWSVSTVYAQLWVGRGNSIRAQLPVVAESAVRTAGLLYVAFASPGQPLSWDIWALTAAYFAGAVASAVVCVPSVFRLRAPFRWVEIRRMFRFAAPLMVSLVLLYFTGNLTQLFVSASNAAGILYTFTLVNGFRILILSLPAAVSVPLFPHLVRLHKSRQYQALRAQTWRALRYTAMAVIPGVVALAVYRVDFINIFFTGTYVSIGALPLAILAAAAIPAALSQIIGTVLNSIGQQRLELYITSLQVSALVIALAVFDPHVWNPFGWSGNYALVGPSVALLLSSVVALGVNTVFMERLLAVRIQLRSVGLITGSAAVSFFAVSRLNSVIDVNRWFILLPAVLLGFVAYGLTLAATGELAQLDLEQIAGAFGIPRRVAGVLRFLCWRKAPVEVNDAPEGAAAGLRPGATRWDFDDGVPPDPDGAQPPSEQPR